MVDVVDVALVFEEELDGFDVVVDDCEIKRVVASIVLGVDSGAASQKEMYRLNQAFSCLLFRYSTCQDQGGVVVRVQDVDVRLEVRCCENIFDDLRVASLGSCYGANKVESIVG